MDIYPLNKSNWRSLKLEYPYDSTITLKFDNFENEQQISFNLTELLRSSHDTSTNKYSNFYLTTRKNLDEFIELRKLQNNEIESFTSYIASDADVGFDINSNYWKVDDVGQTIGTAYFSVSGRIYNLENGNYFDIYFLNNQLCKIGHDYNNETRYLTLDISSNAANRFRFAKDNLQDPYDLNSTQTFNYIYDRNADILVLYKALNDISYLVGADDAHEYITITAPPTAADEFPYTSDNLFKLRPRYETLNQAKAFSNWVLYKQGYENNKIDVEEGGGSVTGFTKSFFNIKNNFLINNEYYNISGYSMPINILTLKNTNTPEENQSRNSPFCVKDDEIMMRNYKRIFTGKNQIFGDDNIKIGYESFTTLLNLPPDQITYFHAPNNIFPFTKVHINDLGFIEAGAVASDHPLKSDKIFKKIANYKDTSPFGNSSGEQSGTFLCSWLSASNTNLSQRPVWIDRYYFPERISLYSALSSPPVNTLIDYTSKQDCFLENVFNIKQVIYDKVSDLTFEPGVLYGYFHIGNKTTRKIIDSYDKWLLQKNITFFRDSSFNVLTGQKLENEQIEYRFDGTRYGLTERVSYPQFLNKFNLNFYLNVDDWTKPFANELIGNYVNEGFGIFNENRVTPYVFFNTLCSIHVYDPVNLNKVNEIEFNNIVKDVIRYDQLEDYFVILDNEEIIRNNSNDISLNKFTNINDVRYIKNYFIDTDTNNVVVLTGNSIAVTTSNDFFVYNTEANALSTSTTPMEYFRDTPNNVNFDGTGYLNVMVHKKQLYFIQGFSPRLLNDSILFLRNGFIWRYETDTKDLLSSFYFPGGAIDMNLDFDNNLWVIHNQTYISKIDPQTRTLLFSKDLSLSGHNVISVDNVGYFLDGEHKKEMLVISRNSKNEFRLDKVDYNGNLVLTKLLPTSLSATFTDTTGGDYIRNVHNKNYSELNLNAKIKVRNVYNYTDSKKLDVKFNLSAIETGYHHISVRLDTQQGDLSLFIDGNLVDRQLFERGKFLFTNFLKEPLGVGTTPVHNNEMLFNRLKVKNAFTAGNIQIKNIYFYEIPLPDKDIQLFVNEGLKFSDISIDLPSGRRNYIDEIVYNFKHKIPGDKSNIFDIEISNSGIIDAELKDSIEKRLKNIINDNIPASSKLRNIIWREYTNEN